MRISFRTTLEQELVERLKQMGKDKNKNMNDILEEILFFYYGGENPEVYFVSETPDGYVGGKDQYLADEIAYISAKLLKRNGIDISEEFLETLKTLAVLIVQLSKRETEK